MAAKKPGEVFFTVRNVDTDQLLVSYEGRRKWRLHAFIGDKFPSRDEAAIKLNSLLKLKLIPQGNYEIR